MQPSPWKRRLLNVARWWLLVNALALTSAAVMRGLANGKNLTCGLGPLYRWAGWGGKTFFCGCVFQEVCMDAAGVVKWVEEHLEGGGEDAVCDGGDGGSV